MPRNDTPKAADQALAAEPIINIRGEKVALGPFTRAHVPLFARWENDFAVGLYSGTPMRPRPQESFEAGFEERLKSERHDSVVFVIYDGASLKPIGDVGLRHIWPAQGIAEFGIAIGERDYWGKGYGTEATTLMLDFAFSVLGLRNVMLMTSAFNERAIRAYTRAGFKEFGRRREAWRVGDRYYDTVCMDYLASEFTSPLPRVIPPLERER
jgi:diamine N-acetyltransferase